ncbi:hypothetical protein [Flaviaesturariibacter aridisoli]|uniref:DUF4398 domain-containing protein n=1 Tax=Flaviaesturariibacter aridisoli TaxID=2545761 RepID=A0A4V2WLV1_9BACT|nr:hypothetical protein [Flaviaesturariibacter aridisoli]TCZ63827.1 hypothetical protein E0486_18420 [Flaviaesturariibacter aridisoli]
MKKNILFLAMAFCCLFALPAAGQKYKTPADTVRLNQELVKASNEAARLTAELAVAQNNLPGYVARAEKAHATAEGTAQQSSDQAGKATNGNVSDARSAKKKARRAFNDAENASDARNDIKKQQRKIDRLTAQLEQKQKIVSGLEEMRGNIRSLPQ